MYGPLYLFYGNSHIAVFIDRKYLTFFYNKKIIKIMKSEQDIIVTPIG